RDLDARPAWWVGDHTDAQPGCRGHGLSLLSSGRCISGPASPLVPGSFYPCKGPSPKERCRFHVCANCPWRGKMESQKDPKSVRKKRDGTLILQRSLWPTVARTA